MNALDISAVIYDLYYIGTTIDEEFSDHRQTSVSRVYIIIYKINGISLILVGDLPLLSYCHTDEFHLIVYFLILKCTR